MSEASRRPDGGRRATGLRRAPPRCPVSPTHCPQRAKWNLATSLQQSTWAGSAVLGGLIADRIGYRNTFLITAALHLVSVLLLAPLLCIVPASDESRRKAARGDGDGRRQPLLPAVEQCAESNPGSPGPMAEQRCPQAATTAETAPASG